MHQDDLCIPPKARSRLSLNKKTLFQQKLILTAIKSEDESIRPPDTRSSTPFCGLINTGNTCYINSIIQVLRFCPEFTKSIQNVSQPDPRASTKHAQFSLVKQLRELLSRMEEVEAEKRAAGCLLALSPIDFVNQLKDSYPIFSGNGQHDAQELLKVLLIAIQETTCGACVGDSHSVCITHESGGQESTCGACVGETHSMRLTHETGSQETTCGACVGDTHSRCSSGSQLSNYGGKLPGSSDTYRKRGRQNLPSAKRCTKKRRCSKSIDQSRMTDYIHTENKPTPKPDVLCSSEVLQEAGAKLFQGSLVYRTACVECERFTEGMESFLDVSIPVVASHGFSLFGQQSSPVKNAEFPSTVGPYSLSWGLSQFAKHEKLQSNNKYWCENCLHLVEAERSILFSKLPPILTIHLNRFSMQSASIFSKVGKIMGNIATPMSLCLSPWCTPSCPNRFHMYTLFAIVFHTGSSCHGGHYTACVKAKNCHSSKCIDEQPKSGDWVVFDDDHVVYITQAKLLDMLSPLSTSPATAYILFYA